MVNLVGNAIKFTDRGEVWSSFHWWKPDTERRRQLRFAFADTGIGIPAEKLQPSSSHSNRPTDPPRAGSAAPVSA